MAEKARHTVRTVLGGAAAAFLGVLVAAGPAMSQTTYTVGQRTVIGEPYVPTIWVDPDGCEHWVMDDGAEGYMSPHVNRQGIPVCHRGNTCGVVNTDQFFATGSYKISSAGQQRLAQFFQSAAARAFIIAGHTDARASDDYNIKLSYNRASAVARIAQGSGRQVIDVRGYGERMPVASNRTGAGMAKNRRVEIICVQ
mgnify:CR=1 FL=1